MMYLVNAFVAGATAVELRNLAIIAGDKVEMNGHGLSNGAIVKASADIAADVTANKLYVVDGATTNDFKLKTFKGSDATGETAVSLTASTTEDGASLKTYGSKKCKITAVTSDKVVCADASFALADKLLYYCTETTGTAAGCKITAAQEMTPGQTYYARTTDAASFEVSAAAPTGTTAGTKLPFASDSTGTDFNDKNWLLKEDSSIIYPAAPKTVVSTGKTWKLDTNEGFCGDEECKILGGQFYYYTQTGTKTDGLTDKTVYSAVRATETPYKFTLKTAAKGANNLAAGDAVAITTAGAGNTYTKVAIHRLIESCTTADKKCKVMGDNSGTDKFALDTVVTFYCASATAADCDYKITGAVSGNTYKVKSAPVDENTAHTVFDLKAATGTDTAAIAVSADSGAKTGGYFLVMAQTGSGTNATDDKTIFPPAAAAGGSAARSFAMLGSAFAMATAFLFA